MNWTVVMVGLLGLTFIGSLAVVAMIGRAIYRHLRGRADKYDEELLLVSPLAPVPVGLGLGIPAVAFYLWFTGEWSCT